MEKNVKIIIGIVISLLGIIVLGSDYYLSLKHEVFDDMNKKYYEQNVVVDDLPDEIDDDQINSGDISENDDKPQNDQKENQSNENNNPITTTKPVIKDNYIGYLKIPKIELYRGFYGINSKLNDVSKNIYVHPASTFPVRGNANNLILASHSGSSSISYFKNLYKLELEDDIYLEYNGTNYHYKIKNIYTVPKNGTVALRVNQEVSTISLITCTKSDKSTQTIYICELVNE